MLVSTILICSTLLEMVSTRGSIAGDSALETVGRAQARGKLEVDPEVMHELQHQLTIKIDM